MNSIREQLDKIAQKYQSGGQISKKYYIKTSLSGDGKSVPTFFDSTTNKQLEGQALQNAIAQEKNANLKNIQHHERLSKSPLTALDITGMSNWGDAWRGIKDLYQMSTKKDVEFNKGDAALDALDIASAIPFLAQRAKYINLSKKPNMVGVLGVQLNHNLPKFSKFAGSNGLFDVASQTAEKARRGEVD